MNWLRKQMQIWDSWLMCIISYGIIVAILLGGK